MRALWTPLLCLMACDAERLELPDEHFDPPSGYTFTEDNPEVSIINLDDEVTVCFTNDWTEVDWNGGDCANPLSESGQVPLLACGFNTVNIAGTMGRNRTLRTIKSSRLHAKKKPIARLLFHGAMTNWRGLLHFGKTKPNVC